MQAGKMLSNSIGVHLDTLHGLLMISLASMNPLIRWGSSWPVPCALQHLGEH